MKHDFIIPKHIFGNKPIIRIRDPLAVVENYRLFKIKTDKTDSKCAVVLKGDVHGLLMENVAQLLYDEGVRDFFVEEMFEGIELRELLPYKDAYIYALAGILDGEEKLFFNNNLSPCINSISQLTRWNNFCKDISNDTQNSVLIHLDTQMNRLGLLEESVNYLSENFNDITCNIQVKAYLSHFYDIKGDDHTNCNNQLKVLSRYLKKLPVRKVSIACTDSVILLDNKNVNYDFVRIGIGITGGAPSKNKPVSEYAKHTMEIYARYSQIKPVSKGETIGYGGAYTVKRDTKIALVHIGYKDGYMRVLSGLDNLPGAYMSISGYRANVIGKISLGASVIDVTDIPQDILDSNYYAEVIGPNVDIRELADMVGCYEILVSLGRPNKKIMDYKMEQFKELVVRDSNN